MTSGKREVEDRAPRLDLAGRGGVTSVRGERQVGPNDHPRPALHMIRSSLYPPPATVYCVPGSMLGAGGHAGAVLEGSWLSRSRHGNR